MILTYTDNTASSLQCGLYCLACFFALPDSCPAPVSSACSFSRLYPSYTLDVLSGFNEQAVTSGANGKASASKGLSRSNRQREHRALPACLEYPTQTSDEQHLGTLREWGRTP